MPRTPAKTKPDAPEQPIEEQSQEEAPVEAATGVFVTKTVDDQGNISTDTQPVNVQPTEVQTLLELGIQSWRQKVGLSPRA